MAGLERDLANAIRFAPDASRRDSNAYDLDLITGRWRGLHARFDQLVAYKSCYIPNWPEILTSPFGKADDVRRVGERAIECDPLSFYGWMVSATASQWLGDFESAIETARLGFEATGHRILLGEWVSSLVYAGRFEEAREIIDRESREERQQLSQLIALAAAQGDKEAVQATLGRYEPIAVRKSNLMVLLALAGERERVNEIAAEIDAAPFGYLALMRAVHTCLCGAPFELEATPQLAKRVEDTDFEWPPISPVEWPLKDW
jgi:hypothetical protein